MATNSAQHFLWTEWAEVVDAWQLDSGKLIAMFSA